VQGYAEGTGSVGVHAVHAGGGTALDINNGSIKVSGGVRAAFVTTLPLPGNCQLQDHPLLNGDPNALVFVTVQGTLTDWIGFSASTLYAPPTGGWFICMDGAYVPSTPLRVHVLVIKQ
jgi:hypothetical protein